MHCRICSSNKLTRVDVREMMFGTREKFTYWECLCCGCLQIERYPDDIARHYPQNYYSFFDNSINTLSATKKIKNVIRSYRTHIFSKTHGKARQIIENVFPSQRVPLYYLDFCLSKNSHILDIGCGAGALLRDLRDLGFQNAIGIDPYIGNDVIYKKKILVYKRALHDLLGKKFDLISLHHSFEHMPHTQVVFDWLRNLISHSGTIILRIPTTSSYAWTYYRENWVQIDAPRHFYLHSIKSIEILADRANLTLKDVVYDSTSFQFWGSELYRNDTALLDPQSPAVRKKSHLFSKTQMALYNKKACLLNSTHRGDQAAFFLEAI